MSTVLGMSFLTNVLGISNTLGAFLAGVLLLETEYRHQVDTEISPFRGILVGLFFFTVGFNIDLQVMKSKSLLIPGIVISIVALKVATTTGLCMLFWKGLPVSQRAGLVMSQGGGILLCRVQPRQEVQHTGRREHEASDHMCQPHHGHHTIPQGYGVGDRQ